MSEKDNITTIRSIYDAFAHGDLPYILDQLDADVEWHAPSTVPFSTGLHRGPDEVALFFKRMAEHVSDPAVETHEFISAGDRVVVRVSFRGRGRRSGVPFEAPEVHMWKLDGGKVIEERSYADTAAIVQALGSAAASSPAG